MWWNFLCAYHPYVSLLAQCLFKSYNHLKLFIYIFGVYRYFACVNVYDLPVCSACRGQMKTLEPLGLELLRFELLLGVGNWSSFSGRKAGACIHCAVSLTPWPCFNWAVSFSLLNFRRFLFLFILDIKFLKNIEFANIVNFVLTLVCWHHVTDREI